MPLTAYKRRHTDDCLKLLADRQAKREIEPLTTEDLKHYRHCRCVWWLAEGSNDYGKKFTRRSLGVYTWEAACLELKKLNQPEPEKPAPGKQSVSLSFAIEEWKKKMTVEQTGDGTVATYLTATAQLTKYYAATAGLELVSDLTPEHITAMRAEWEQRELARTTRNDYLKNIKKFLKFCRGREYLTTDPMEGVKAVRKKRDPVKDNEDRQNDLDEDEVATLPLDREGSANYDRILAAAGEFVSRRGQRGPQRNAGFARYPENFAALLRLKYETGLRVSDATFFEADKLIVDEHGGIYTTKQIKTGRRVTVFPSRELCQILQGLPRMHGKYLFFDGRPKWKAFINTYIRVPLHDLGVSLGIDGVRPHRFRDSFAVNELNRGTSWDDLKDLLGHGSVRITELYYGPWVPSRLKHLRDRQLLRDRHLRNVIAFPKKAKRPKAS